MRFTILLLAIVLCLCYLASAAPRKKGRRKPKNLPPQVSGLSEDVINAGTEGVIHGDPTCRNEIETLCPKIPTNQLHDDFLILHCIEDSNGAKSLSEACHHTVWKFMHGITTDQRFPDAVKQLCKDELESSCPQHDPEHFVPCMLELKDRVRDEICKRTLVTLSTYMFSDYRFISPMIRSCESYIHQGQCGRIADSYRRESDQHTQGAVIECLMQMETGQGGVKLDDECKRQILRVAELQSNDFHQDRPLYFACREARESFCDKIPSGDGRIYRCLMMHKFERGMPEECVEKLTLRQKMFEDDIKVDMGFLGGCGEDLKKHCAYLLGGLESLDKDKSQVRLFATLHCLDQTEEDFPNTVSSKCRGEMEISRKMLFSDYKISTKVVNQCENDITTKCGQVGRNGATLHCLMKHARPSQNDDYKQGLTKKCFDALSELMTLIHMSDIEADPVFGDACQAFFDQHCIHKSIDNRSGLDCMLEMLSAPEMAQHPKCEAALLEVQYFAARDWTLTPDFHKACVEDAGKYCKVTNQRQANENKLAMPCLYRELNAGRLSSDCTRELKHIMRLRSSSIDLQPEIEDACTKDLSKHCSHIAHQHGAETKCLEDNYQSLEAECKEIVKQYVMVLEKNPDIDDAFRRECLSFGEKYCADELRADGTSPEMLACLVANKHQASEFCQKGIERYQLLALNDFHFSPAFASACESTIETLCAGKEAKADVIRCLSDKFVADVHQNKDPSEYQIPVTCRKYLKAELMQREEKISLDPRLQQACSSELDARCADVEDESGAKLQCLKDLGDSLSSQCYEAVFKREKLEAIDPNIDPQLRLNCHKMIVQFCSDTPAEQIMTCLANNKENDRFDQRCHNQVVKRLREESKEVHLKPILFKACVSDIKSFCKLDAETANFKGAAVACLRNQYLKDATSLTARCEHEMEMMMRGSVMDYKQDPVLAKACKDEIQSYCSATILKISPGSEDEGQVEECLRSRLVSNKIRNQKCKTEVSRVLLAGRADVHVDPKLSDTCAVELETYCKNIPLGQGRKMTCLLNVLNSDKSQGKFNQRCLKMLKERSQMWAYAKQFVPAQSINEIWEHVTQSPSRGWVFTIIAAVIVVLLLAGMCFGRVTKRVNIDMKSK